MLSWSHGLRSSRLLCPCNAELGYGSVTGRRYALGIDLRHPEGNTFMATEPHLVDRATRLFTFLAKAQQLKQSPVRDFFQYRTQGSVTWFVDLLSDLKSCTARTPRERVP